MSRTVSDPHAGTNVLSAGITPSSASGAIVLVHGRGATAEDILSLLDHVDASGFAALAPQARGHTWYPDTFLAPIRHNQPFLDSALKLLGDLVRGLESDGISRDKIVVAGFSQGACLASEFVARSGGQFGGLLALSGGLIGTKDVKAPPPEDKAFDYETSLDGTPAFFGCSDIDPHIPVKRVDQSVAVYKRLGADVTRRIYPGMPHTVNQDEMDFFGEILASIRSNA